jgi:phage nucleotide-binding protein
MQFQSTKDFSTNQLKILIIGESGAGKTHTATTVTGNPLIINAENGLLTLQDYDFDVSDISQAEPAENKLNKLIETYNFLRTQEAQDKYQWVFIDSLTEISQILVQALHDKYPDRKDGLVMWGEYSKRMKGLIKAFRDLKGYHVVMTALDAKDKDDHGRMFHGVDMSGKISSQCPALFDEVFFLRVFETDEGDIKRAFQTRKNDNYIAKDRSGKLDLYEPTDLAHITTKIYGGK